MIGVGERCGVGREHHVGSEKKLRMNQSRPVDGEHDRHRNPELPQKGTSTVLVEVVTISGMHVSQYRDHFADVAFADEGVPGAGDDDGLHVGHSGDVHICQMQVAKD